MSGTTSDSVGRQLFQLGFQISPIILSGGVAQLIPGGMLPIVAITEALNFTTGLLSGGTDLKLDDFFAQFIPVTGATLIDNQIGTYPFANQVVAANAIISQPLRVSMKMICPVRQAGGYAAKLVTMSVLQSVLMKHNSQGGTYIVVTPSGLYQNCVMTGMRDISSGESRQAQTSWQLDFMQPLLTLSQAAQVQNTLLSKIENGLPTSGTQSGPDLAAGSTLTGAAAATAPVSSNLTGTSLLGSAAPPIVPVIGSPL